jgi:hypothetical protein
VIVLYGFGAFVLQWTIGVSRDGITLRSLNWPVKQPASAIRFPDGRYAVAIDRIGRIQVYDASGHFQYGWQSRYPDNILRLRSDGTLAVYAPLRQIRNHHPWAERVYDENGTLLADGFSDLNVVARVLPGQSPTRLALPQAIPAWLAFPLYGPFYGWAVALGGGMLVWAGITPEKWAAMLEQNRQLRMRRSLRR